MVDMLADAAVWLGGIRTDHMSGTITYQRGSDNVEISATRGSTTYEVTDDDGATVEAVQTDFIIATADLVLDSALTKPEIGDRIILTSAGLTLTFEVLDLGGTGHFRLSDQHGVSLRIHTKQIDEA